MATLTPSTKRIREGGKVTFVLKTTAALGTFDADDGTSVTIVKSPTSAPDATISAERETTTDHVYEFDVTFPEITGETTYTVTVPASVNPDGGALSVAIIVFEHRQGRASANPAAGNYGTNLVAIVAEQDDYFHPVTTPGATLTSEQRVTEKVHKDLIELRPPFTLTPTRQFYEVQRLKGNPTPDPSIPGMVMGAGELNFYLTPSALGFWFKHLLQATEITSVQLSIPTTSDGDIIFAAGKTFTSHKTGAPADSDQPEKLLHPATALSWAPPVAMRAAQVEITPSATAAGYKFKITGTDNAGAPLEETLNANSANAVTSAQYFRTIKEIERIPGATNRNFTVTVKAKLSSTYRHTFKFDSDVSEGLSIEVQEGSKDTPIRYNGALVTRGIIRLEEVARAQFMVIANEVEPRKALHGGADGTNHDNFERPNFDAVSAPTMAWNIPDIDDQATAIPSDMRGIYRVAQLAFAADNRIAPPQTAYAQDFFYPKPVRKMNREMQTQVVIDHSKEADFDQFTGGATFISELIASSYPYGEAYSEIRVRNNQTQLVNNPTRVVQGLDEVLQQIVMRSHIGDAADGNDDTEIFIINQQETI